MFICISKSQNIFEVFQTLANINKIVSFDKEIIKTYKENQQIISNEVAEIKIKIKEQEEENQLAIEEKQSEIINAKNEVVAIQKEEENKRNELLALPKRKEKYGYSIRRK